MKTLLTALIAIVIPGVNAFAVQEVIPRSLLRDQQAGGRIVGGQGIGGQGVLRQDTQIRPIGRRDILSPTALREIDRIAVKLEDHAKNLHDEFHEHLEGIRHASKLDKDVSRLEKIAEALHQSAHNGNGSERSMKRLRADTNELLQLSSRIGRTIDLTESWLRSSHARTGIRHMRSETRRVAEAALRIDAFLPIDTAVIDSQADRLETAVKVLHDEFHEHLDHYEVSRHLDQDIEDLEKLVEHLHDMAHNKSWASINLRHAFDDVLKIQEETRHIEQLFVQQGRIGVRTRDWIGIEHSRDAITDVLASAGLLQHMITKADPRIGRRDHDLHRRDRFEDRHRHDRLHNDRFDRRHDDHFDRRHDNHSDRNLGTGRSLRDNIRGRLLNEVQNLLRDDHR